MTWITCQLDVRSDWSYELFVVPHWNPAAAVIERFDAPMAALLRHAEVARHLRADGWTGSSGASRGPSGIPEGAVRDT